MSTSPCSVCHTMGGGAVSSRTRSSVKITGPVIRDQYWLPLYACLHRGGAWEALEAGYAETHRAFNAWGHIGDLLRKLDRFLVLANEPKLVGTAILWHASVYKTQNADGGLRPNIDNVRDSADLFRRYTLLDPISTDAVYAMIMALGNHMQLGANRYYYVGFEDDLHLFLDLDLSPLGSTWGNFCRSIGETKTEFAWMPDREFYGTRARILRGFTQDGVRLFRRDETDRLWGRRARANVRRLIPELERKALESPEPA